MQWRVFTKDGRPDGDVIRARDAIVDENGALLFGAYADDDEGKSFDPIFSIVSGYAPGTWTEVHRLREEE